MIAYLGQVLVAVGLLVLGFAIGRISAPKPEPGDIMPLPDEYGEHPLLSQWSRSDEIGRASRDPSWSCRHSIAAPKVSGAAGSNQT